MELGNLATLRRLSLTGNQLSGVIPAGLGDLTLLDWLMLQSNQLSGEIPDSLLNLTLLQVNFVDLSWNALFTSNPTLDSFLDIRSGSDWSSTQTIAPVHFGISAISGDSIALSWDPIEYTGDTGRYRVLYSETSGGILIDGGVTADKTDNGLTVTGLAPGASFSLSCAPKRTIMPTISTM